MAAPQILKLKSKMKLIVNISGYLLLVTGVLILTNQLQALGFYLIEYLFVEILFIPLDILRAIELDNWWIANFMTWVSIVVFICAFTYWMLQLKKFDDNQEEDKSISAHSFL